MDILTDLHSCVEKSEAEWDLNDYFLLEVPFGLLCASEKKNSVCSNFQMLKKWSKTKKEKWEQ